jgi:hypothetical protein
MSTSAQDRDECSSFTLCQLYLGINSTGGLKETSCLHRPENRLKTQGATCLAHRWGLQSHREFKRYKMSLQCDPARGDCAVQCCEEQRHKYPNVVKGVRPQQNAKYIEPAESCTQPTSLRSTLILPFYLPHSRTGSVSDRRRYQGLWYRTDL